MVDMWTLKQAAPEWTRVVYPKQERSLDDDTGEPFYHAAPTEDRERIRTHGLMPSNPGLNPYWTIENEGHLNPDWQPEGVYLSPRPKDTMGGGPHKDIWEVDPSHIDFEHTIEDPEFPGEGFAVVKHQIPPEALRLHIPAESSEMGEHMFPGMNWAPPEGLPIDIKPEWKIGQPTAKLAWELEDDETPAAYYHAAPTEDRARILQHGLQPSRPYLNDAWEPYFDEMEEEGVPFHEEPEGVYMADYPGGVAMSPGQKHDIWRIDPNKVRPLPDPHDPSEWYYSPHPIPPHALALHTPFEQERIWPGEQQRGRENVELQNAVPLVLKPEWKIGKPTPGKRAETSLRKTADKLHDFLMNPKSRPDLQTEEGQAWLRYLDGMQERVGDKLDPLTPWLTREWKKKRIEHNPGSGQVWFNSRDSYSGAAHQRDLYPGTLSHWADFMRSNHPLKREMGDIMQHKMEDFHDRISAWNEAMKQEQKEQALKGGKVVHQWPDGWSVRQLTTPEELKGEGEAMGHCVGGYCEPVQRGDTLIYSLRDHKGIPHATTEIEPNAYELPGGDIIPLENFRSGMPIGNPVPNHGSVVQIQGAANEEPKSEYKDRMREWFEKFHPKERPIAKSHNLHGYEGYEGEEPLDDPENIKPGDHSHASSINEYGLEVPPREVDWYGMTNQLAPAGNSPRTYHEEGWKPSYEDEIYKLAKDRGEIPQMARSYEETIAPARQRMDELIEQNADYLHEYSGGHPEFYDEDWEFYNPAEKARREKEYDRLHAEGEQTVWNGEPHIEALQEMDKKLEKHWWRDDSSWHNEPYEESLGKQTFGGWKFANEMWTPGHKGKGIIEGKSGNVIHWNVDEMGNPHHYEMGYSPLKRFDIAPWGEIKPIEEFTKEEWNDEDWNKALASHPYFKAGSSSPVGFGHAWDLQSPVEPVPVASEHEDEEGHHHGIQFRDDYLSGG